MASSAAGSVVHAVKTQSFFGWAKKAYCGYLFPRKTKVVEGTGNVTCRKCRRKMR